MLSSYFELAFYSCPTGIPEDLWFILYSFAWEELAVTNQSYRGGIRSQSFRHLCW